ncbi:MAG: hypothetical protein JSU72_11675 [Deltaproteobacteria bacterium]|nr:MAG: hypothetical protein JSU72_11675 [Deltaproteobacteria bacterium]
MVKQSDFRSDLINPTLEHEVHLEAFRLVGANHMPMAWGEALTALKQGNRVVLEHPLSFIFIHDIYDY